MEIVSREWASWITPTLTASVSASADGIASVNTSEGRDEKDAKRLPAAGRGKQGEAFSFA